ncbi:unnamed protein product, partial [Prorocentrum cordatum]
VVRGKFGVDQDSKGEWFPIEYVTDEAMARWRDDELVAADRLRSPHDRLENGLFPAAGGDAGGTRTPPPEPEAGSAGPGGLPADWAATYEKEDLRTCWIDADETGARFKEWRKVVQESTQEVFSDSNIRGPPVCLEICRKMYRRGGAPKMWFQEWCKEQGVTRKDRAYHEVQTLIEVLYLAGTHDQLNMGALASLEVVSRRLLQYVEAYAHGADQANWGAAKYLGGTTNPLDLAPDALHSYVSRLSKEEHELVALRTLSRRGGRVPDRLLQNEGQLGASWVVFPAIAPLAALPDDWCEGLAPGQRRRWLRDGNAACKSMNYLHYGEHRGGMAHEGSASQRKMDLIRADAQQRALSAARRWIDVDSAIAEKEALARLLKGKAGYAPLGATNMGSHERSRVSLPDSVLDAPALAQMLPADARIFLEGYSTKMLLPPREAAFMRELRGFPGCEGLGRIEVPALRGGDLSELRVVLGVGDVADCFHRMKMQGDIRRYPPLAAPATGEALIEGQAAADCEMVWPMSQSLPMGFSRSLFFAQDLGHFMCVDIAGVLVRSALYEAQADFDGATSGSMRLCARPTDERFAAVRKGLRCLLRQRNVAGWQLEMALGHVTFMALGRREVLSVFHAVYALVASSYHAFSVLWPIVREELECYLGLMVMLESRWNRDWMPFVCSSDASLYGHGVAEAQFDSAQVALVGRVSELSRWRLGAGLARQHAFETGSLLNSRMGEVVRDAEGVPRRLDSELLDILNSERWKCDPGFPELPHELLRDSHWKTVMADRWVFADDILRLEARALVKAASRAAHSQPVKDCRVLLLWDNLSVVLCFCRFRFRDFRLLIQRTLQRSFSPPQAPVAGFPRE